MSGISNHLVFNSESVNCTAEVSDFKNPYPAGELLNFTINPFTGKVVLSWQDNPKARLFIYAILREIEIQGAYHFFELIRNAPQAAPLEVDSFYLDRPDHDAISVSA